MSETQAVTHSYTGFTRYDGDMWVVFIEGLPGGPDRNVTQSKRFTGAQHVARDYVACLLDVPIETVHVDVRIA